LAQDDKIEKLTKAVDILQKEINLLKGNKKWNYLK
jgi:cell division protein FtsB